MATLNVKPGTLFIGDNLEVLRGIDTGTVDLVYLDPPFHTGDKKRGSAVTAMVDGKKRKQGYGDAFDPSDLKREWVEGVQVSAPAVYAVCEAAKAAVGLAQWAYLVFMAARLLEIHRVLKETGSCWLHCDWHADGWLRALMDAVFGAGNLRNTVAWCYTGPGSPKMRQFNRKHDVLLWYSKGKVWTFNKEAVRLKYAAATVERGAYDSASPTAGDGFRDTGRGKVPECWWADIPSGGQVSRKERTGWEDQKPLALLHRIILACSNRGDVVLDPFCGCATALVSAQIHHRAWIGIDQDPVAEGVLLRGYWNPKGEKKVGRLVSEAGLFDVSKETQVLKAPPARWDDGQTACDLLENEFRLRQQQSMVLSKAQQAKLKQELYVKLEGKCQGLAYANGERLPCPHDGMFFPIEMFHLDHIRPKSKRGRDIASNFQVGCSTCNGIKADHLEPPKRRKGK